jgi:hypothetical protein
MREALSLEGHTRTEGKLQRPVSDSKGPRPGGRTKYGGGWEPRAGGKAVHDHYTRLRKPVEDFTNCTTDRHR